MAFPSQDYLNRRSILNGPRYGFLKVVGDCHCEAVFAEAIPLFTEETASQKPLAVTSRAEFLTLGKP
jgi:hypothetical protein